jgi:hypothetical protein
MEFSQKRRDECKEVFKKHGANYTDAEADEALGNMAGLFELLFEHAKDEARLNKRLKKEPGGFPIDKGYSCLVCGNGINPTNGWWDHYGPKCLLCQKAIRDGIVPAYICKHRNSYFSTWKIAEMFKVKTVSIRRLVREGKLKARIVLNEQGKPHEYIFLKKDNPTVTERYNPIRKSYDRNRNKVHDKWAREKIKELKAEFSEKDKSYKKKIY